jgi:hypothetical protein
MSFPFVWFSSFSGLEIVQGEEEEEKGPWPEKKKNERNERKNKKETFRGFREVPYCSFSHLYKKKVAATAVGLLLFFVSVSPLYPPP